VYVRAMHSRVARAPLHALTVWEWPRLRILALLLLYCVFLACIRPSFHLDSRPVLPRCGGYHVV
jgi:hypothetical protein